MKIFFLKLKQLQMTLRFIFGNEFAGIYGWFCDQLITQLCTFLSENVRSQNKLVHS